jgi:N-acetylneuraminic acid mutarotase
LGSTSWVGADRKLYLFGGEGLRISDMGYLRNVLWRYDPASNMWTWLTGAADIMTSSTYGTRGVPAVTNTPGSREGAAGWTGPDGKLYLLGGKGLDANRASGQLNDLWRATGQLNDLWRFDPASGLWTWLGGSTLMNAAGRYGQLLAPDAANWQGGRDGATAWVAEGKFYLFGGYGCGATGAPGLLNDLWRYDPASGQWTWLKGGKTAGAAGVYGTQGKAATANTPGGRKDAAGAVSINGKCFLFGGIGVDSAKQTGFLNDFWQFDPVTLNWTWQRGSKLADQLGSSVISGGVPAPANTPSGRTGAAAWLDANLNLFVFGGFGLDASGYRTVLMDLWVRGDGIPAGRSAARGWSLYH